MAEYLVSFECVWSTVVEADSDEEAEEIAESIRKSKTKWEELWITEESKNE